jgi:hypothetical protein
VVHNSQFSQWVVWHQHFIDLMDCVHFLGFSDQILWISKINIYRHDKLERLRLNLEPNSGIRASSTIRCAVCYQVFDRAIYVYIRVSNPIALDARDCVKKWYIGCEMI